MGVTSDLTTQASRMDAYLANNKTVNKFCYTFNIKLAEA